MIFDSVHDLFSRKTEVSGFFPTEQIRKERRGEKIFFQQSFSLPPDPTNEGVGIPQGWY